MPERGDIYVFDAFGTLFDVHSAARYNASRIGQAWPRLSELWRSKQLEYSWIHAALGTHMRFEEATRQGLIYALHTLGLSAELAREILPHYRALAPFAEVPDVMSTLKSRGARLAILSNGDGDVLADLVANARLDGVFDAVLSVEAAGTFKPNARVYALACAAFAAEPAHIRFFSSNRWDIAGAGFFGFVPVWVNRGGAPDEYPDLPPQCVIANLRALLD